MSVKKYKSELHEAVLDLIWKQWTALGVPGQMAVPKSEMILDPEALLLFSAGFARYDQRLYDLILDWLQIHSAQINIQRLKALHAKAEWKDTDSLGYMCKVIAESDPVRWRKTAEGFSGKAAKQQTVLFRDRENEPEKFIPNQDPLALRCGFVRNIRCDSEKIPDLLPKSPATLLLQMRGLLGISARAETILILLTSSLCKVQDIVDRSCFTWKSIQDVLAELSAGGYVSSLYGKGRGKQYFLTEPEKMLRFFGLNAPVFWNWAGIYDAAGLLWQACSNPFWKKVSEETIRNELQSLYREKLQKKLLTSGCAALGKTNLDLRDLPRLIQQLCR